MNATEDGEPLGESPAIDTLTAIGRGAVLGILGAADEVLATKQLAERQGQALSKIRVAHIPGCPDRTDCVGHADLCSECGRPHPCPTIRALDEAGA